MFKRLRSFLLCFVYVAALAQGFAAPRIAETSMSCSMTACTCKHDKKHSTQCCCMVMGQRMAKRMAALEAAERAADPRPWMKDSCSHDQEETKASPSMRPHLIPERAAFGDLVLVAPSVISHPSCLTEHPEPPNPVPD